MRVVTNKSRARRNRARQLITTTLVTSVLLITLFTFVLAGVSSAFPDIAKSPFLLIGMAIISAVIGLQSGGMLVKIPISHEALEAGLKGFGKDTTLYNYWLPASHVFITPKQIYSLTVRTQDTTITFNDDGWTTHNSLFKRIRWFLTQTPFRDPLHDAEEEANKLQQWLEANLPEPQPTVHPLIVFVNPKVTLTVTQQPRIPVAYADKRTPTLKAAIRAYTDNPHVEDITAHIDEILNIDL